MDAVIGKLLPTLRLGSACHAGALSIVPLFAEIAEGPEYVTLGEALAQGSLVVGEAQEHGIVGELVAANSGESAVVIITGEELVGAKQNRVLNTTVLIPPGSRIVLPVSCTEAGRWSYASPEFRESGYVASRDVRAAANDSVTASVRSTGTYRSDQGRVWNEVDRLSAREGIVSGTHAMRDVYEQRRARIVEVVEGIRPEPGQRGVLAVLRGRVIGFDFVSRSAAYARLHDKLLMSYGLESLTAEGEPDPVDAKAAMEFVAALEYLEGTEHPSPGMGVAHRYAFRTCVGSALSVKGNLVHAAFFAVDENSGSGPIDVRMAHAGHRGRLTGREILY